MQCTLPAEVVIEAVGMTDMPTVMWMPSCRGHAALFAHWATTQILALGRARLVPIDRLKVLPKRAGRFAGRLMAPGLEGELASPDGPYSPQSASQESSSGLEIPAEDDDEWFTRLVGPATPLPVGVDEGAAAELAAFDAAATWGLPDFVFKAHIHQKSSGTREVGDAIVLLHDIGLVVQVKRRESESTDPDKEARWIRKVARKAVRQSHGSLRTLQASELELINAREEVVTVRPGARRWVGVVIIDHPNPPRIDESLGDSHTAVMTRRDWEFLHGHLKSTRSVVKYVEIMPELDPIPLGAEAVRYHELAAVASMVSAGGLPGEVDLRRHFTEGPGMPMSIFPQLPVGTGGGRRREYAHVFYRFLLESIAIEDWDDPALKLEILSFFDSTPPVAREAFVDQVDRRLRRARRRRRAKQAISNGRLRINDAYPQMVYTVARHFDEMAMEVHKAFLMYEHHKFAKIDGFPPTATSIGLLIAPGPSGESPWQVAVSATKGDPELDDEVVSSFRQAFGRYWDDDR
jgi:hypothetical protein